MQFSTNSNMYTYERDAAAARFAAHVQAGTNDTTSGLFCVLSAVPLPDVVRTAFVNSAAKLGFGTEGCFFATLSPISENGAEALDDAALFALVEGFDPLALVAADEAATAALTRAYAGLPGCAELASDAFTRLNGRNTVVFRSFERMLESQQAKQLAWGLLKRLGRQS